MTVSINTFSTSLSNTQHNDTKNISKNVVLNHVLYGDRLEIPNVNKNDAIQRAGKLGKIDIHWGQADSTNMPSNQKSKQSRVNKLSLQKWVLSLI
jgi:hypothetical protein